MAKSPITGNTDLITYKIMTNGKELGVQYQVISIDVEKAINQISTAKIVLSLEYGSGTDKTFAFSEEKKSIKHVTNK